MAHPFIEAIATIVESQNIKYLNLTNVLPNYTHRPDFLLLQVCTIVSSKAKNLKG